MTRIAFLLTGTLCAVCVRGETLDTVWLDELDLSAVTSGDQMDWGRAKRRGKPFAAADVCAKRNLNCFGESLSIASNRFARGVGVLGNSLAVVEARGKALWFDAVAGADTTTLETWRWGKDVWFQVWADDRLAYSSGFIGPREQVKIHVDVKGAWNIYLQAFYSETHEYTPVDWCDARFTVKPDAKLRTVALPPARQLGILTPPERPEPRINGPALFGVRPGHPVLYTLPVTGERPMKLSVTGLPEGATFDAERGFVRGRVAREGTYRLRFAAENAKGRAERTIRLVVGDDAIALTPPMCWNSWNCFARTIDEKKIKGVIDAFVDRGLVNHGWSYVNLDDFWMRSKNGGWATDDIRGPGRDERGEILPNQRFPDMKALADYAHDHGMKLGLYSSPGPETCGGCYGSWGHEVQDAATFAKWGIDFLKYDWCSLGKVNDKTRPKDEIAQSPYKLMGDALRAQDRDIVFDICQYGGFSVWAWGKSVGGHMWRTTGDIMDIWGSCLGIIDQQIPISRYPQPGGWNDPDMMIVGSLGWGRGLRPSRLTPNEQYTHVSLWAMLAAPLQIGCDIAGMDDFTYSLLANDEILDINQDELGRAADCVTHTDAYDIWLKPLSDGSLAAAFFNRTYHDLDVKFDCHLHGIVDGWRVRCVWAQKDLGVTKGWIWKVKDLPPHATLVLRFSPPKYWLPSGNPAADCPDCPHARKD